MELIIIDISPSGFQCMYASDIEILILAHRIAIEHAINDESTLSDAVRDEGTLEYIAQKAGMMEGALEKAAWALWSIANYHPFVEGNKRAALLSSQFVLGDLLFETEGREEETDVYIRDMAAGNRDPQDVGAFITMNAVRTDATLPSELEQRMSFYADRLDQVLRRLSA